MKQFPAIPVYPLRMRGRFGMTNYIFRHGGAGALFYTLLYRLVCLLLSALALAPVAAVLLRNTELRAWLSSFRDTGALLQWLRSPGDLFAHFNFDIASVTGMLFGVLCSGLLALLCTLFLRFYVTPRYTATLYNEMASRVYGASSGFSGLWKKSGPCLRRYYSTYLAHWVGTMGAGALAGILGRVLSTGFAVVGVFSSALGVAAAMALGLLALLFGAGAGLAVSAFVALTFPVGMEEKSKGFDALGRSLTLVWRNYGRILCSKLLLTLLNWACLLPAGLILLIGYLSARSTAFPFVTVAALWSFLVETFFTPYRIAFDTVLYEDAAAREGKRPAQAEEAAPDEAQRSAATVEPTAEATDEATAETTDGAADEATAETTDEATDITTDETIPETANEPAAEAAAETTDDAPNAQQEEQE